jgi:hypothetical protein
MSNPPSSYGTHNSYPHEPPNGFTARVSTRRFSYHNKRVEIHESARKHGVADPDTLHAIEHALALEVTGKDPDRWLLIGPDTAPRASRAMTNPSSHGHANSGQEITDEVIEQLAAEAEAGYDVDTLIARRSKRGRPTLGASPASVESVRLDPELQRELLQRAQSEGTTTSELIREALRRYLHAA